MIWWIILAVYLAGFFATVRYHDRLVRDERATARHTFWLLTVPLRVGVAGVVLMLLGVTTQAPAFMGPFDALILGPLQALSDVIDWLFFE